MEYSITKQKYIYKYMPINEFTLKSLINNELFFGIPAEFNDPLDCKFILVTNPPPTLLEARKYYESSNLSKAEIIKKIELFNIDNSIMEKDLEKNYIENLRKEYGVTCFSEKPDSILMWSHYAEKHKGICLKFDWKIHEEYFKGLKVKYSKKLPEITYDGKGVLEASNIFLTKLNFWKYEKEIRSLAKIENGKQIAAFNPKALKSIIFGERVSDSDRITIKKIISGNHGYSNVSYLNASVNVGKIKVDINK